MFQSSLSYQNESHAEFAQSLLSNLLGSIGYFQGDSQINSSPNPDSVITTKVSSLFTCTPSRSKFARGFLWDEGFHLLVVLNWDMELALEILQSWFALMDDNGWIAREQILGPEARSTVPEEFRIQTTDTANPPTLFLVVEAFIDKVTGKSPYLGAESEHFEMENARTVLWDLYPKLKKYHKWFRETQKGDISSDAGTSRGGFDLVGYRWRGQTDEHILASGLDDYPRSLPSNTGDLHVDAISWVGMMSSVLAKVADFLEIGKDKKLFTEKKEESDHSIELIHWSETDQAYCDTTITNHHRSFVCHKGYVSILPFLLGHVDADHPRLLANLDLMRAKKQLWSPHGLRSLSKKDKFFETDENYWRGPVWININYLALTRLFVSSPCPSH